MQKNLIRYFAETFPLGSINGRRVYALNEKDEEVGEAIFNYAGRDGVDLDAVVVKKAYRGQHIGTNLVKAIKKYVHKERPYTVKYAHSEVMSHGSLSMLNAVLGEPLLIDNDIRCLTMQEALEYLPRRKDISDDEALEGHKVHVAHWIGKGRRPKVSPFRCD